MFPLTAAGRPGKPCQVYPIPLPAEHRLSGSSGPALREELQVRIRWIVVLIALTLIPSVVFAGIRPQFVPQFGLGLAKVSAEDLGNGQENKSKLGLQLGGSIILPFVPVFALQPGLFLEMKGGKRTYQGPFYDNNGANVGNGEETFTGKYTYLTVPVMARFTINTPTVKPYLKIGPQFSLLLSANGKDVVDVPNANYHQSSSASIKDDSKSIEMGLGFAGGTQFPIVKGLSGFGEIGYTLGLTDITDEPAGQPQESNKNRVFFISVGVIL
jgi:hypothetical protein